MAAFQNPSYVGHYSKSTAEIPGIYNGMRVEVLDEKNELLFVADTEIISEDILELVRTSELFNPEIPDEMPVSIRGFNAYQNRGIHVAGKLSRLAGNMDSAWLVRELDLKGKDTGRIFSRRPIKAQAWVRPAGDDGAPWLECRVVNASAGGVCFRCVEPLEPEGKLCIRFRLRPGREQPPLNISIRRMTDRGSEFEYGCEFVDLSPEVDTIITRTVIQLQIMQ